MRIAVLRVSGREFDAAGFVEAFALSPDRLYGAGEPNREGRVRDTSGFNVHVADEESVGTLAQQVVEWVHANQATLQALRDAGAAAEIDVGLSAGANQFYTSVTWSASDLALFAACGVGLGFTAYRGEAESDDEL